MESMRLLTGAQIDVPGSREAASPTGRAEIKIKGSKKAVEEAKKLIEEKAKFFDNTITRELIKNPNLSKTALCQILHEKVRATRHSLEFHVLTGSPLGTIPWSLQLANYLEKKRKCRRQDTSQCHRTTTRSREAVR